MPVEKHENALLVTERAIGSDQNGRYLLTVNSENMVEKKPIRMGRLEDGLRVIEEGLQPDDRVVVNGIQRARPGAKVDPEQTDMKSLTDSVLKASFEAGQHEAKPAIATSKGGDSQPGKEPEKKE